MDKIKNTFFRFKQFQVNQEKCAMKVTTDGCLFGAWVAREIEENELNHILDIGTGTGLLSLMIAQKNKAGIDGVELDPEAAVQAAENFSLSPWKHRLNCIQGDAKTVHFKKAYDTIISNPPFYENEIPSTTAKKNIAHHSEGLLLAELIDIIKKKLSGDGYFYLLLPYKRYRETTAVFKRMNCYFKKMVKVKQSVNHDPFRFMIKAGVGHSRDEFETGEISIRNEKNGYTESFAALLKDYYLGNEEKAM